MRLLVISDIHANLDALEACLASAPEYDAVANLGDVVGYGASPNEVVDRVKQLGQIFVRGNHDRACSGLSDAGDFNPIAFAAASWTKKALTDENRTWVADLPRGPVMDEAWKDLQFVHGSPADEDEYILSAPAAEVALAVANVPVTFFGHTHVQGIIGLQGDELFAVQFERGRHDHPMNSKIPLEEGVRYLINPGSIGQPRDGDPRAGFALYDSKDASITFYRIPYDIKRAQHRIVAAGLPDRLAARLTEGR